MNLKTDQTINIYENQAAILLEPIFVPTKKIQIFITIAASLTMFCSGCSVGYSSPALPSLDETGDFGILTENERSWIGSLVALGGIFGGPIFALFANKIGRKKCLIGICFPFFIGWILIFFAKNLWMIYIGRIINGIGAGAATLIVPIYISEIAHKDIRGSLGLACNTFNILGIIFMFGLGIIAEWDWLALYASIFPVLVFVMLFFVHESPRYLLDKGMEKEAAEVLMKLRGAVHHHQIKEEIDEMMNYIADEEKQNFKYKDLYQKPEIRKPILLSVFLNIVGAMSGVTAILFYSVDIFLEAESSVNANLAAIIVASAVVLSFFFMDRAGRRVLLILSEIGIAVGLSATGLFFYLKDQNDGEVPNGLDWLPVTSIVIFFVSYSMGIGSIPPVIYSEIIPHHVKGIGTGIVVLWMWIFIFGVTKSFDSLRLVINDYGFFWFYGSMSIPSIIYIYFWIPETKGKSLETIQKEYFLKQK